VRQHPTVAQTTVTWDSASAEEEVAVTGMECLNVLLNKNLVNNMQNKYLENCMKNVMQFKKIRTASSFSKIK
jgi:hypothetical protein